MSRKTSFRKLRVLFLGNSCGQMHCLLAFLAEPIAPKTESCPPAAATATNETHDVRPTQTSEQKNEVHPEQNGSAVVSEVSSEAQEADEQKATVSESRDVDDKEPLNGTMNTTVDDSDVLDAVCA